jgi:signal peptidase I
MKIIKVLLAIAISIILIRYVRIYVVSTSSMEPSIKINSFVVTINTNSKTTFKQKEIIVYKIPQFSEPITHRIVRTINIYGQTFFITKGDINKFEDPYPISRSEIIGKVLFSVPYIIPAYKILFSYKLLFFSLYIPLGFLIGTLYRLNKEV